MKPITFATAMLLCISIANAQNPDLASLHSTLTTDCKNIRGHAGRIVAEASQTDLNKDVALAHLEQVEKYHSEMEEQLKASKELLTSRELERVGKECTSLEKTCTTIGTIIDKLKKEFSKTNIDRLAIRRLASSLRSEMSAGSDVHEQLKKKLGIL